MGDGNKPFIGQKLNCFPRGIYRVNALAQQKTLTIFVQYEKSFNLSNLTLLLSFF